MHWKVSGSSLRPRFLWAVRLLVEAGAVDQPGHHRHLVDHHRQRRLSFVVVLGVVGAGCLLHHRVKGVAGVGGLICQLNWVGAVAGHLLFHHRQIAVFGAWLKQCYYWVLMNRCLKQQSLYYD